jgi:hypothetical protein
MGTPTIDTTAKTITWGPTTPAVGTDASSPYAFTPRATASGGQGAVGSAQSVVVSAASASKVLVQQAVTIGASTAGSIAVALGSTPTAGNTLVMQAIATNTLTLVTPSGWTLVSRASGGSLTGQRVTYKRTADGTEGTSIASPSFNSGNNAVAVQEWQGSVTVTPAETGNTTAGTTTIGVGPFAAPPATAVPVVFCMTNGASSLPPWTWPTGWTSVGPLDNGAFPSRGNSVAYGVATASAVSALTIGVPDTKGSGKVTLWMGAWIS